MDDSVEDKTRKTITLTHKQAGLTFGGLTSFFAALHFLSANYASKADVKVIAEQLSDVKGIVTSGFAGQKVDMFAHANDETHKHERMMDTIRSEIRDEKDDRIREIEIVESLLKVKKTKTN